MVWNEVCKEAQIQAARDASLEWVHSGKTRYGCLCDNIRWTIDQFKLLLRQCHLEQNVKVQDALAKMLLRVSKNTKDSWEEVKSTNGSRFRIIYSER